MVIAWRSVVDGCVLICLLCRVFFKVRANRRVGKSKDPKKRVPEIAVPDLVPTKILVSFTNIGTVKKISQFVVYSPSPKISIFDMLVLGLP